MYLETLPLELLSSILHQITHVPEALDTSFEAIQVEDRQNVVDLIRESLASKTVLSLVSKQFHSILQPLLYEHIIISKFKYVPILLDLLRVTPREHSRPRGYYCRRLDIYLGTHPSTPYNDEAWYEGGHTLWGLIPACPNLQVLLAHIIKPHPKGFIVPHLTHTCLWKTISTILSHSLRRLELYGFSIRMDRVEMMLRYMTYLEVAHIFHCVPFRDMHFGCLSHGPDADIRGQEDRWMRWYPDVYDDEEPSSRTHYFGDFSFPNRFMVPIIKIFQSKPILDRRLGFRKSEYFSVPDLVDFRQAKSTASWPPFESSGPPYTLPHLHTLTLSTFTHRIFQFDLPSLRALRIGTVQTTFPFKIYPWGDGGTYIPSGPILPAYRQKRSHVSQTSHYQAVDWLHEYDGNALDSPIMTSTSISQAPLHSRYTFFPFPTLPNSTLFGPYSPSITHLYLVLGLQSIALPAPITQILWLFPNITHLSWEVNYFYRTIVGDPGTARLGTGNYAFKAPHTSLRHVTIHEREGRPDGAFHYAEESRKSAGATARWCLYALENGWVANLCEIVVVVQKEELRHVEGNEEILPYEKCRQLGVRMTVESQRESDWIFFEQN